MLQSKRSQGIYDTKEFSKIHKTIYNTSRWKKLRLNYLIFHPVCEACKKALAVEVHHINEISNAGGNVEDMKRIGFDENNLMAVCPACHKEKHKHKRK